MNANKISHSLGLAVAMIALSLALAWAGRAGMVGGDLPTRISMVISALVISFYGNAIPKVVLRSARARSARRFAGWGFALSGLISAAVWIAAPIALATEVSIGAIGATFVLVFGYCLVSGSGGRRDEGAA